MRVVVRQAWQQKHPSPSHAGWDFHWHPRELGGAVQALAQANARGDEPVAVWSIGPRHVVWLRGFSAVAAAEQRRYVGWAGCAVEPAAEDEPASADPARFAQVLPAALARLELPPARPCRKGDVAAETTIELGPLRATAPPPRVDASVARAAWAGGEASSVDPHASGLPALFGSLLTWLPAAERARPRSGIFVRGPVPALADESARNLVHYLHRAWQGGAHRPWRLVLELAAAERASLADVFVELTRLTTAWDSPAALQGYLGLDARQRGPAPLLSPGTTDAGRLWNRVLHYWGRGFVDLSAEQLAAVLARRIVCDHLLALDTPGGGDPERYLRRLRFESMLQARDQRRLRAALTRCLPSLEVKRERA
jgi:hypothetical protein